MDVTERVIYRLKSFGYDAIDGDVGLIEYLTLKVEGEIKNFCNIEEVPEALTFDVAEAVCAEFLRLKLATDALPNVEGVVTSIKAGDTTVNYDSSSNAQVQLLGALESMSLDKGRLTRFRKMEW